MGDGEVGRERDPKPTMQRLRLALLVVAVLLVAFFVPGFGGSASAQDGGSSGAVTVTAELGLAGIATDDARVPVRVALVSDRSREVQLEIRNPLGSQYYEVPLNADAETVVDAVIHAPFVPLELVVRDSTGEEIGKTTLEAPGRAAAAVAGVGQSLAPSSDPFEVETVAGIQEVTAIPLGGGLLDRPGALGTLSALVLGPQDLERLTETQSRRIAQWVDAGGDLAIDQVRVDPLPVIGTPASQGNRTAVGAGWVRFTDGAAARGDWSAAIEPVVLLDDLNNDQVVMGGEFGFGNDVFDEQLANTSFIQVSYMSGWVIVIAVFATALVVGPLLWALLRTRRGRSFMWVLAPGLSVLIAAALLVGGQGALSDASGAAVGSVISTPFGTLGEFGIGTTSAGVELDLGTDGQVWASEPRADMAGAGEARSVEQSLGTNEFGYLGLGVIDVSDTGLISVEAIPSADGSVSVTIENSSSSLLRDVTVSGFTVSESVGDVAPGTSTTEQFDVDSRLNAFGPQFPFGQQGPAFCMDVFCVEGGAGAFGRAGFAAPSSRGVIGVSGTLTGPMELGGEDRRTITGVVARAALTPGAEAASGTMLRVDSVGNLPGVPGQANAGEIVVGGGPDAFATTTQVPLPVGPDGLPIPEVVPAVDPVPLYARITAPVALPSLVCSVHTVGSDPHIFDGDAWRPLEVLAEPEPDPEFAEPNMAVPVRFPALAAGEVRYIRVTSGLTVNVANIVDCAGAR